MPSSARYSSLSEFYTADPRRVSSKESDIGLWWRESADGPLHRAAWVRDTGELYLARLGPAEQGGGLVEVLAVMPEERCLQDVLYGWRQQCGRPDSLVWLREQTERLRERARAAQLRLTATATTASALLIAAMTIELA
jgi:hypothetical protein